MELHEITLASRSFCHPNAYFLDFLQEPPIEIFVPVQVRGPLCAAAYFLGMAASFLPLLGAGRATACCVESVPFMPTVTGPQVGGSGFPIAFWAGNFYFSHVIGIEF
jgi:hypothetical protein